MYDLIEAGCVDLGVCVKAACSSGGQIYYLSFFQIKLN